MTLTQLALGAAAATVAAGWCLRNALRFGPAPVGVTYRRLYTTRPATTPAPAGGWAWERWFTSTGERIARTAAAERFEARRRYALRAANVGIVALATRVVTVMVVAFVGAVVLSTAAYAVGTPFPAWVAVAAPFAVAGLAGWYQLQSVLTVAERRYREFRSGVAAYVALVSVCMTTRRSMTEAVTYAADVGTGPAFTTIAAAVHAAPQMGIRVWEALDAVGAEYGCRELQDLASSVGHVARIGVGVESTVTAVATRMRQVALDDMQRRADRQTSTMFGPTMLFVLGTVAFLAYPLAVRVLDAFSTTS
jgi:Flp pilus assembly protein TadB